MTMSHSHCLPGTVFWKNWKPNEDLNIEGLGGKEEEGLPVTFNMISSWVKEEFCTHFLPASYHYIKGY